MLRKRVNELADQIARMQQDRIAELTAQIERTQQDLREAETAERAAEAARKNRPSAIFLRWLEEFWLILATVLGFAILATTILVWTRHRIIQNAMSDALAPRFAGTMNEQAYGDDSLISGAQTRPRQGGSVSRTAHSVAQWLSFPSSLTEQDFDHDIAKHVGADTKLRAAR